MAWVTLICGALDAAQHGYSAYVTRHTMSALKLEEKDQERIHLLLNAHYTAVRDGAAVVFTQVCIIVYARKLRDTSRKV